MRPAKRFNVLRKRVCRRLGRLRANLGLMIAARAEDLDRHVALGAIDALNTWAEFCRAYYLSCVRGARLESGARIVLTNSAVQTTEDAIDVLIRTLDPRKAKRPWRRREEPAWHEPRTLLVGCSALGCSHEAQVVAAFSIQARVFTDLPVFRNFYAHRNHDSAQSAMRIGLRYNIAGCRHPTELLCRFPYGRPQALVLDWLDEMIITSEFLCT